MADEEINTDEEEVAKETTLQDMVEELSESNILQKSLEDSAMKTTEVLTTIAKILQAQLDLSEKEDLDDGRKFDKPSDDDDDSKSPFEKLEMPTSPAEGLGLTIGLIGGLVSGYFRELNQIFLAASRLIGFETKNVKGESSKAMKRLKAILQSVKNGIMRVFQFIGRIFAPLKDIGKMLPSSGVVSKFIKGFMAFFKTFGLFFQALGRVVGRIFSFIVAPIMGFIKAFEEFENQQEGGMTGKIIAGVMGFITGFLNFMVFGLIDLAKSAISWVIEKIFGEDNAVTTFLDSFTFTGLFEGLMKSIKDFIIGIPKYFTDAFAAGGGFTGMLNILLNDYKEMVGNLLGFAGELFLKAMKFITDKLGITGFGTKVWEAIVKSLDDAWIELKNIFSDAFDKSIDMLGIDIDAKELVTIVSDWWNDIMSGLKEMFGRAWEGIKSFFGINDTPSAIPMNNQSQVSSSSRNDDGLYEKNFIPFTKSAINRANIPLASEEQLQKIIDDDDLTEEDMQFVTNQLNQLTALKSIRPAMSESEEAQAVINRAESKRKRDAILARKTPEEMAEIYASLGIANPAVSVEAGVNIVNATKPEKIGIGTLPVALNRTANSPMILRSTANAPSPALLGNEGSAVNQGQALQSGTSNLKDAKSKQNNAPPMVLQSSANNSKTSNSNVSNNYTTSNVTAWDRYDPFSNQMPSNAAK